VITKEINIFTCNIFLVYGCDWDLTTECKTKKHKRAFHVQIKDETLLLITSKRT